MHFLAQAREDLAWLKSMNILGNDYRDKMQRSIAELKLLTSNFEAAIQTHERTKHPVLQEPVAVEDVLMGFMEVLSTKEWFK